jgi:WD40 repeat protein/tRNA A-37 threonylcarbamoyl transferase component Bud32
LVEGPNLAEWLKDQTEVSLRVAVEIVRDIARAIHFAHDRGIVHRDLKPSNILLRPRRIPGSIPFEPLVTDFGLAHRPHVLGRSMLTATQAVLGTDQYMSPEQVRGTSNEVGPQSDIFSLGVILYELVAGHRPFDAENSDEIRRRIREDDPAAIGSSRIGLPKDLETIVLKCLEKQPNRRYDTAGDLAEDLTRFLKHEPIRARPATLWNRANKYARRKPHVLTIAGLAICSLLLICGLFVAWIADRISAGHEVAAAKAAAEVSDRAERQHQYTSNIQHAAEALRRGRRREMLELLGELRTTPDAQAECGIEWGLLWNQANEADRTLAVHPSGVSAVRFSPTGHLMVSGGKSGKVIFWDTDTWERCGEVTYGAGAEVSVVEFSGDGSLLAIGGENGRLAIYRVEDRQKIYDETVLAGRIFDLAWTGETNQVAVGGEGAMMSIVDPMTHQHRQRLLEISPEGRALSAGHPEEISALVYLPGRKVIAAFLNPRTTCFINPQTLETVGPDLDNDPFAGAACRASMEQDYLVATKQLEVSEGTGIGVWRATDGSQVGSLALAGHIQAMRYSPATHSVAVAFRDGAIQTCDMKALLASKPAAGKRFCAHNDRVTTIDFSPDGAWLASGGLDGDVKAWRVAQVCSTFDSLMAASPSMMRFSPCGRWLATVLSPPQGSWELLVLDPHQLTPLWSRAFPPHPSLTPYDFAFAPNGEEIAIAEASRICVYDATSGSLKDEYPVPEPDKAVTGLQYSRDGESIFARRSYGTNLNLNWATGRVDRVGNETDTYLGMFRTIYGDEWLVSKEPRTLGSQPRYTFGDRVSLAAPSEKLQYFVVSHDGAYLAGTGGEGVIYFWDLKRPNQLGKLIGHEARVDKIEFSVDGRTILSQSQDGTARLWHVATHEELLRLGTAQQRVVSMALNPAGTMLVLGVKDDERYGLQTFRLGPPADAEAAVSER